MTSVCAATHAPFHQCEVFVIGGGPAGATMGALLADQGRDVVVMEKAHHPRFHIGESLLPANIPLLEKLGVRDQIERIGMPKWGVEFVSPDHQHKTQVEFGDAWDKSMPFAFQVRRADFDEILFRNAATKGARTQEGSQVRQVVFDDDGATVQVVLDDGAIQTWRTRFVVDASGRDTLLANQFKSKEKNHKHNSAAIYGHFTGAKRLEGRMEGNITIFWFEHGWFWFIPLADGTTSVGAVCWPYYLKSRNKPLPEFFRDTIAKAPELAQRLAGATLVDEHVHATGNYSYSSRISSGDRYLMVGDAYAFIDPVFSSGVHLAMQNAFDAVPVVLASLEAPHQLAAARSLYDRRLRHGPKQFSWFIYRVTNPMMRQFFMYPQNPLRVKEAVLSMLAGDIFGKTPIWRSLRAFKAMYYIGSAATFLRTWRAWRRRQVNIQDLEAGAPR